MNGYDVMGGYLAQTAISGLPSYLSSCLKGHYHRAWTSKGATFRKQTVCR